MVGTTTNRYLVIEGPIGVGKSSLARLLTERLQARLVLEKGADHAVRRVRLRQI